jgi:hypothetical protein
MILGDATGWSTRRAQTCTPTQARRMASTASDISTSSSSANVREPNVKSRERWVSAGSENAGHAVHSSQIFTTVRWVMLLKKGAPKYGSGDRKTPCQAASFFGRKVKRKCDSGGVGPERGAGRNHVVRFSIPSQIEVTLTSWSTGMSNRTDIDLTCVEKKARDFVADVSIVLRNLLLVRCRYRDTVS